VPLTASLFPQGSVMSLSGETVRWTQVMELREGMLTFEVTDGTSSSWGSFGGQGYLKASVATPLSDLNGYDPAVSVANSGVSYGGNRVESLTLKAVRLFTATGEELADTTPRVVHPK